MGILIRDEQPDDIDTIDRLTEAAFANQPYSSHTEQFIVRALRQAGALTLSLVAVRGEEILGHVAVSPVQLSNGEANWHGLGPISVRPDHQRRGIGSMLMQSAIQRLKGTGSAGCVLLGEPAYYARFGFKVHPGLELPGVPAQYFQALPFGNRVPQASVSYHGAFDATA